MHFIATFEVRFEALKGDPALGRKTPACVHKCFMTKWLCFGLFPVLFQEGGLQCFVKNLNLTFKRYEPTTEVPAVN